MSLALALAFHLAAADEGRRFAGSHITPAEWQAFFEEVRAKPGAHDISRPDVPSITAIEVPNELTIYFFTKPGWAAHPAVVVERVLRKANGTYLQHDGYFAGSEDAFASWFAAFTQRSQAIRSTLLKKR